MLTPTRGPRPDRDPLPPAVIAGADRAPLRRPGLPVRLRTPRGARRHLPRAGGAPSPVDSRGAEELGRRLVRAFGERFRVELQRPFWRHDRARNRWLEGLAARLGVPCVATGNVHMHERSRAALQDTLVAVRLRGSLEETEPLRRANGSGAPGDRRRDGRALPRPPRRRRRDGPHGRAHWASTSPATSATATPGSEDPGADRALAELCRARLEHRYAGMRRVRPGDAAGWRTSLP